MRNKDVDVSTNHLPDSAVMEKLGRFLAKAELVIDDGACKVENQDFVKIFENTEVGENAATWTGWCLLDDDFEFCMIPDDRLLHEAGKSSKTNGSVIDWSSDSNISPKTMYFIEPRLVKIYYAQWLKCKNAGNETFVRFDYHDEELFSYMFPFFWEPEEDCDVSRAGLGSLVRDWSSNVSASNFHSQGQVEASGFRRFGANRHFKHGERMRKCVMHCVNRHPIIEERGGGLTEHYEQLAKYGPV